MGVNRRGAGFVRARLKSLRLSALFDTLLPILVTLAALAVGAVMLILLGVNPIEG